MLCSSSSQSSSPTSSVSMWSVPSSLCAAAGGPKELDDFWSTHQRADQIAANMGVNKGDTFQVLLIVLWLYTREAWLRHVLDALSIAVAAAAAQQGPGSWDGEGATGSTPLSPKGARRRCGQREVDPLVTALAPCAQLLQSALLWFEEAGIQHLLPTFERKTRRCTSMNLQRPARVSSAANHGQSTRW
ncbi:unnamed protein product [Prorocentrum cordatum]|uniref:Anaphase-promoting complex subunit 1 n=1 Tax=Prorocentrum cordatum TaxID=2364126 RepID=A0ABN9Q6N9_9DINO|nr:unnamed protein product [Polarella glacialis]